MKSLFCTLVVVAFISTATNAQVKLPKTTSAVPGIGNLVTQFTEQINPTSFTDQWTGGKSNFLGNAGKITNAVSAGKTIASLIGFLKPGMFKQGFNVQNLLNTANTVKTMSQAAGVLKNLEGGLKPEAFMSSWSGKRTGWLNALNLIK